MAAFSYLALTHSARAQLYLLSTEGASHRCLFAVNRIKQSDFYHQSFCRSMSTYDVDNKNIQKTPSTTVTSKDIHDQPVNDDPGHTTDSKMKEMHDFHSTVTTDTSKGQKNFKQASVHSSRTPKHTVSQYLKQSWLNYYSSTTKHALDPGTHALDSGTHALDSGTHNQLLADSQSKVKRDNVSVRNRPRNTFGNLSLEIGNKNERPDWRNPNERMNEKLPDDIDENRDRRLDIPLTRYGRQNYTSFYYTRKISINGRQGKIKEALAIFEYWMMVRDRVMPSKRTFVVLIGILGRVGYTDKAFELFQKMKQLRLDPVDHIYTSLFNACANSPSVADGLKRTEYLLDHMKEKGFLPNLFTVKAAMKALAITGDFSRAFTLLDISSPRLKLDIECFNHLLMACISDKEAGFKRALQVWQKMSHFRIRPSTATFNLLLRSARDCGVGHLDTFCSAFDLDSLAFKVGEDPFLLENISQSFDGRNGRGNTISLPRPALLPDSKKHSDVVLEVTGRNMNIYSSPTSEQPGSSRYLDDAHNHVSEHSVPCKMNPHGHAIEQEITHSRSISPERISNTTEDLYNGSGNVSGTYSSTSLPQTQKHKQNTPELWEEKSSDFSNSKLNTSLAVLGQATSKSLYSEILTQDTGRNLSETKVNQLSLKDLKLPSGRLALLGGASKFISYMETVKAQPDIRTFTQVLACLPNNEQSEFELLQIMEKTGVKPDIDFLNDIMMQRNMRRENDTVKAVLKIASKLRLTLNMRTYAALALTCIKEKQAHELLEDMKAANVEPNSIIMGHFIFISQMNFTYKLKMLKTIESLGLKVTRENIATIEKSIVVAKKRIIEAENKKDTTSYYLSEYFQRSFQYFMRYYKTWLIRSELDKPRHPWDSFKFSREPKQKKEQVSASS